MEGVRAMSKCYKVEIVYTASLGMVSSNTYTLFRNKTGKH